MMSVGSAALAPAIHTLPLNYHQQNTAQTVVLTHLPPFLRGVRILRDASYPCGSARTVHLGSCVPFSSEERRKMKERGLPAEFDPARPECQTEEEAQFLGEKSMENLKWKGGAGGVAVVKMGHFIGAQNFAGGMLALAEFGKEGRLPPRPGPDGLIPGADVGAEGSVENGGENGNDGENGEKSDQAAATEEAVANEEKPKPTTPESQYTNEERSKHAKTLSQLKNMRVHHLFSHSIPDPIPPDMEVPQSPPAPGDPAVPYNLLEALTTLRERYEQMTKDAASKNGSYSLSTSVSYINDDEWGGHAAAAGEGLEEVPSALKMDTAKLSAAAGGGAYDEEADPLNAPDVVKAVLQFKRQLEDQNAKGKKRRVEIISDRMGSKVKELLEKGRKERAEMRLQLEQREARSRQLMQAQQVPAAEVGDKPQSEVEDTGRRGVSNLPAWMTKGDGAAAEPGTATEVAAPAEGGDDGKKRKFVPSEANRDINVRKQKLEMGEGQSLAEIRAANEAADKAEEEASAPFVAQTTNEGILSADSQFPTLAPAVADTLKTYVTAQIVDFLGEEESTLIEFIMKELAKDGGCTTASLLEEMKVVLDEDAEDFVLGLYRKMVE